MNTSRKNQAGSHHVVLVGLAVFGLIGLLGFVGYNSWQKQSSDAGSLSTVGRSDTVAGTQKDIKKVQSQLSLAAKQEKQLKEQLYRADSAKDALVSGVTKGEDETYAVYLKNYNKLKKEYLKITKKPGATANTPAVKKAYAKFARAEKLYKNAVVVRKEAVAYRSRLASERKSEPVKSLWEAKEVARKENAPLKASFDKAEKTLKKVKAAYDKNPSSKNFVKMYSAIANVEVAQTNLDVTQSKLDAARESLLGVTSTWPEQQKFAKRKVNLKNSREKYAKALKSLKISQKKTLALQKQLTNDRKKLKTLKDKAAGKKVNKKEAAAERSAINASKKKVSGASKKASTAKKKNAEVKRKVDQSSKKAIQKKQSNNNQKKRNRN